MTFDQTAISGAFVIELEKIPDQRGFFARSWCSSLARQAGLIGDVVQCNISFNRRKGTLRGMHFQAAPHQEAKTVRCIRGAVYDVIVDLRPHSPSFRRWEAFELSAENRKSLYVPPGVAHGFQTLEDDCELYYQMSEFFHPESARGVRWNDPAFAIEWPPEQERIISQRDREYPDFRP